MSYFLNRPFYFSFVRKEWITRETVQLHKDTNLVTLHWCRLEMHTKIAILLHVFNNSWCVQSKTNVFTDWIPAIVALFIPKLCQAFICGQNKSNWMRWAIVRKLPYIIIINQVSPSYGRRQLFSVMSRIHMKWAKKKKRRLKSWKDHPRPKPLVLFIVTNCVFCALIEYMTNSGEWCEHHTPHAREYGWHSM